MPNTIYHLFRASAVPTQQKIKFTTLIFSTKMWHLTQKVELQSNQVNLSKTFLMI